MCDKENGKTDKESLAPREEYGFLSNKSGQKEKKKSEKNESSDRPKRGDNGDDLGKE